MGGNSVTPQGNIEGYTPKVLGEVLHHFAPDIRICQQPMHKQQGLIACGFTGTTVFAPAKLTDSGFCTARRHRFRGKVPAHTVSSHHTLSY